MASTFTLYRMVERGDWRQTVLDHLVAHLRSRGYEIRVAETSTFELQRRGSRREAFPLRDSLGIIQNDGTGALHVLDFHDWPDPFDLPALVADPRCRVILKCQYRETAFQGPAYRVIRPWTYFEGSWPSLEPRLAELRRRRRTEKRLYFRGQLWKLEREPVIRILQRRGLLSTDVAPIPFDDYLDEMSRHRLILSLPGMGEFCHRDLEGFALGTCVLRTHPENQFHDELKANHHFITVPAHVDTHPPEVVAERIEERFLQVIDNVGYLNFVAHNAREWYDRNVRLPGSMELTETLLGLER